jgi:hypothetical protein
MRALFITMAVGLILTLSQSASAQMCSMCAAPQTQAQSQAQGQAPAATPSQPGAQQAGGCACCRNMAMMRGGQGGGMNMPGMEMPKPQP